MINKRLTDIDNDLNRHTFCGDKCLKRKDGSLCMNCKYKFPKEPRSDSKSYFQIL